MTNNPSDGAGTSAGPVASTGEIITPDVESLRSDPASTESKGEAKCTLMDGGEQSESQSTLLVEKPSQSANAESQSQRKSNDQSASDPPDPNERRTARWPAGPWNSITGGPNEYLRGIINGNIVPNMENLVALLKWVQTKLQVPDPRATLPEPDLREALVALEKYFDEETARAFTEMQKAKQDGDMEWAKLHEFTRDTYSDATMKVRAALESSSPVQTKKSLTEESK
jgi:hypothetical protein